MVAVSIAATFSVWLSGCGGGNDVPAPTTAAPTVASAADFAVNMQGCLREAGWETTIGADGGLGSAVPDAQAEEYRAAHDACLAKFGYDQPPAPMERQAAEAYLAALVDAADCLVAAGYDVPPRPSEEDSLAGLMSPELDPGWDIYGNISDGRDLQKAQSQCPVKG